MADRVNFSVPCRCPNSFAIRLFSRTDGNPNRWFWRCHDCGFFAWENTLAEIGKVYHETAVDDNPSPPTTPPRGRPAGNTSTQTHIKLTPVSNKRARSASPPAYTETGSLEMHQSSSQGPLSQQSSQARDEASTKRLTIIQQSLSQNGVQTNTPVAKARKLSSTADAHSGDQHRAYMTPSSITTGNNRPALLTPFTPTRKGKERDQSNYIDMFSPTGTLCSSQSPSQPCVSAFETHLSGLRHNYELCECRLQEAEQIMEDKNKRIKELEDHVKYLEGKLKNIQKFTEF